jgi:hypothetical protein
VQDLAACGAICGATVSLLDENGVPISGASALSDPVTGVVDLCLSGDLTYTPTASAVGYPLVYYGEIQGQLGVPLYALGMLSNSTIQAFAGVLPGFSSSAATVIVNTETHGGGCGDNAGWSVALALPDGGVWPDGGYSVLYSGAGTGIPDPSLTATTTYGIAIVVGIDTSVSDIAELLFTKPNPGMCPSINLDAGFTGRIRLGAGDISSEPIELP